MDNKQKNSKIANRSNALEEQIKEQQRRKEDIQLLEELGKRITIARDARLNFEKENFAESMKQYRRFLSLTARGLKVEVDGLDPKLFDEKTRVQESLLISSSLLDLAKILDMLNNESANKERADCLRLYVKFTLGQPFQGHSAMNLRKFIEYTGHIRNKRQFWSVYNTIKVKKFCVVATAVYQAEDHENLNALRKFRDERLGASAAGRFLINTYYEVGPALAAVVWKYPAIRKPLRSMLDLACRVIRRFSAI